MNINDVRVALAAMLPSPPYSVGDVHYGGRYTDGDLFKTECVDWDGFRVCGRPVEVHFEAQQAYDADKPGILRLDCHFAPYDEFANLSDDNAACEIKAVVDALADGVTHILREL